MPAERGSTSGTHVAEDGPGETSRGVNILGGSCEREEESVSNAGVQHSAAMTVGAAVGNAEVVPRGRLSTGVGSVSTAPSSTSDSVPNGGGVGAGTPDAHVSDSEDVFMADDDVETASQDHHGVVSPSSPDVDVGQSHSLRHRVDSVGLDRDSITPRPRLSTGPGSVSDDDCATASVSTPVPTSPPDTGIDPATTADSDALVAEPDDGTQVTQISESSAHGTQASSADDAVAIGAIQQPSDKSKERLDIDMPILDHSAAVADLDRGSTRPGIPSIIIEGQPRRSFEGSAPSTGPSRLSLPTQDFLAVFDTTITGLDPSEAAARLKMQGNNYSPHAAAQHHPGCADKCLPCLCITYMGYRKSKVQTHDAKLVKVFANMSPTSVLVIRGGVHVVIHPEELVVGDVVQLAAGDKVLADMRVVKAMGAQVLKYVDGLPWEQAISAEPAGVDTNRWEADNFLFYGNGILRGTVTAVVIATGANGILANDTLFSDTAPRADHTRRGVGVCARSLCCLCGTTCGVGPATTSRRLREHGVQATKAGIVGLRGTTTIVLNCQPDDVMEHQRVDPSNKHNRSRRKTINEKMHQSSAVDHDFWDEYWESRVVAQKQQLSQAAESCHRWGIQLVLLCNGGALYRAEMCELLSKPGHAAPTVVVEDTIPTGVNAWRRLLGVDRSSRDDLPVIVAADVTPASKAQAVLALRALGETVCYVGGHGEVPNLRGVDVGVTTATSSDAVKNAAQAIVLHNIDSHTLQTIMGAIRLVGGMPVHAGFHGRPLVPLEDTVKPASIQNGGYCDSGGGGTLPGRGGQGADRSAGGSALEVPSRSQSYATAVDTAMDEAASPPSPVPVPLAPKPDPVPNSSSSDSNVYEV